MASDGLHIVVFPWLAFGHMLPYLDLSKSLARKGHKIYFISTPRNIQRLPKLPPQISHHINFISFNLPPTEGLRDAAEATTDIPPDEVSYLKKAFDGLEHPFTQFINEASPKPDWIIRDFAQHWIPSIGIPCAYYITVPAAALVFFGPLTEKYLRVTPESLTVTPPWVPFPSKVTYRLHEAHKLFEDLALPNPSGANDFYRYKTVIDSCKVIASRSCRELESEYLSLLEEMFEKPVIPVGLLPPSANETSEIINENEFMIMEWLDKHRSRSVVYVALGSEAMMSIELLHELALGLELVKLPFIWGLRRPFGLGENVEMLPQGFKDRTREYGIVVQGWVPQVKILAHESVGGFLTHCGWSSIVEGLQSGRPLVLLPIFLDQGLNARLMEEKEIGVEVEKNDDDGSFTREDVAKAVRLVMVEEEGERYRKKAEEMKEVLANKEWHEKYVEDFIQYLVSHRR